MPPPVFLNQLGLVCALGSGKQEGGRALAHVERLGMPVRPADLNLPEFDTEAVLQAMRADKKVAHAKIRFVCLNRLGEAASGVTAEDAVVREVLLQP